jgi:hypothetical protein
MGEKGRVTSILVLHFFRRFFDNDTIHVDGDTLTTVVRAVSVVTVPGLMISFFLQSGYPGRSAWGAITDQYIFVLLSFVVMGAISIFEGEMLFPDRLDFLILSPLSLKSSQMLAAKAAALIGFLSLFIVSCNLFGAVIFPALSKQGFFRQIFAHGVAVLLAGIFAALFFLAIAGVLICTLGATRFRLVSPLLQMFSITLLAMLILQYAKLENSMQVFLAEPLGMARWIPPFWFLGVYEQLLHGEAAAPFARELTRYAFSGIVTTAGTVVLTYPIAWAQMRKMALEGSSLGKRQGWRSLNHALHFIVRRPAERAVFHFIGQTIARNNRYQIYLAVYCGTGLALAMACAITLIPSNRSIQWALSTRGLHAVMPLLLFWVIGGLRTAFDFPLNLPAGWVFRITGARASECAAGARKWVFFCTLGVMCGILIVLRAAGWGPKRLFVQAVCGVCLCILMTDGFFLFRRSVPFNRPRMPGRTSLPFILTLYLGVLPPSIFGLEYLETTLEKNLLKLFLVVVPTVLAHGMLRALSKRPEEVEEEMEGYECEFQLLGLS